MWEPRPLTPLWAFTACYRNSFTFYFTFTFGMQFLWSVEPCSLTLSPSERSAVCGVVTLHRLQKLLLRGTSVLLLPPFVTVAVFLPPWGATGVLCLQDEDLGSRQTFKWSQFKIHVEIFPVVDTLVWSVTPCSWRRKNLLHLQGRS
jgi:hypothetical protein